METTRAGGKRFANNVFVRVRLGGDPGVMYFGGRPTVSSRLKLGRFGHSKCFEYFKKRVSSGM